MSEITAVGLDLAKNVFVAFGASSIQAHRADASGRAVLKLQTHWSALNNPHIIDFAMKRCGFSRHGLQGFV